MDVKYRPEVDGLRGIAVLSVLLYHLEISIGSYKLFQGGYFGVDIFFTISGYLITTIILSELDKTGHFSFAKFYERRARRLLPALFVVLLACIPLAWLILLPSQLINFSKSLIASIFFYSNFFWYHESQVYGADSSLLKPLLHTWSLAVEEQYYLIFPIIFLCIYRFTKSTALKLISILLVISLIFAEWQSQKNVNLSFYILLSRFWELLTGSLVAYILYYNLISPRFQKYYKYLPGIGLLLLLFSVFYINDTYLHPGLITLFPVIGTLLIIVFTSNENGIKKLLSSNILVCVGLISYSLYLWHYPIYAFGRLSTLYATPYDKFQWLTWSFILAIITFLCIETPFRNKAKIKLKTFTWFLIPLLITSILFANYAIKNQGVRSRFTNLIAIYKKNEFDNQILKLRSWRILGAIEKDYASTNSKPDVAGTFEKEVDWFTHNPKTKKILIIGDSHSKDMFNAFYLNSDLFKNFEFARFALSEKLETAEITDLINAKNFSAADIILISFRYNDETIKKLPALITQFKSLGKQIWLTSKSVEFKDIQNKPIFDWYMMNHNKDFDFLTLNKLFYANRNIAQYKEKNIELKQMASQLHIKYFDKEQFLCQQATSTCDGITPYGYKSFYDYGHYTLEGAKYFGKKIHALMWLN